MTRILRTLAEWFVQLVGLLILMALVLPAAFALAELVARRFFRR